MNLVLHITPETEIRHIEQANLTGKKPEDLALEALHDKLSAEPAPSGDW